MKLVVLAGAIAVTASALAVAVPVKNGGFESGLAKWRTDARPDGAQSWDTYCAAMRGLPPPQGQCAAFAEQNDPATQILHRTVKLPADRKHELSFRLAYFSGADFITPQSLSLDQKNQQLRIDVMKPDAPLYSVKDSHVLKNLFRTDPGEPTVTDFRTVRRGLNAFAGDRVRLRFAVAANQEDMVPFLDAVKIKTRR